MALDFAVIGLLLVLVAAVGIRARLAPVGRVERFAAGRQSSWFALGASMAATSTSADTPLLIAGAVYADGFAGNWFWWASAPGVLASLFFFARLWRRSGVLTEIEIVELRYGSSRTAKRYRVFRAMLDGFVVNMLVLAINAYAFGLLLSAMLTRWNVTESKALSSLIVVMLFLATGGYAILVGFRGLVRSDATEFGVTIIVSAILAWFAISTLPNGLASLAVLEARRASEPVLDVWPSADMASPLLLLAFSWWQNAPGKGMLVQRMVASRDERSAMLTVLMFATFHYLLRPWGWYLIGAAALFHLPALTVYEQALPELTAALLPEGLFGLLMATMALAFMASVNSRLNLGASFLVNDVALVARPSISNRGQRVLEILAILGLSALALAVWWFGASLSIRGLYQFLIMMMAGSSFVAVARWYWWRTTIWSEITSTIGSAVVAGLCLHFADVSRPLDFAVTVAINLTVGTAITVIAIFCDRSSSEDSARAFNDKVRPGGPGWRKFGGNDASHLRSNTALWLLGNLVLFGVVFAITRMIAMQFVQAIAAGSLAAAAIAAFVSVMKRNGNFSKVPG